MQKRPRIAAVVDAQLRNLAALRRAVARAQALGADLHLCMVDAAGDAVRERGTTHAHLSHTAFTQDCGEWLLERAEQLRPLVGPVRTHLVMDPGVERRLRERIDAIAPDLAIAELPAAARQKLAPRTSLGLRLLRECPAPLLLIAADGEPQPRRVVAALPAPLTDASSEAYNRRLLAQARDLASAANATLHVLHACALPGGSGAQEHQRENQRLRFNALCTRMEVPAQQRHFVDGTLERALADHAGGNDGVAVIGAPLRGPEYAGTRGARAEDLIAVLSGDVMVVRPPALPAAQPAMPRMAMQDYSHAAPAPGP